MMNLLPRQQISALSIIRFTPFLKSLLGIENSFAGWEKYLFGCYIIAKEAKPNFTFFNNDGVFAIDCVLQ